MIYTKSFNQRNFADQFTYIIPAGSKARNILNPCSERKNYKKSYSGGDPLSQMIKIYRFCVELISCQR